MLLLVIIRFAQELRVILRVAVHRIKPNGIAERPLESRLNGVIVGFIKQAARDRKREEELAEQNRRWEEERRLQGIFRRMVPGLPGVGRQTFGDTVREDPATMMEPAGLG